ncbi:MAG: HAD hydrolase-like protein, partial [Planctomycetota bacterium]|nr:HAD hydrolase-like protein [Planctomycetota bacterium]
MTNNGYKAILFDLDDTLYDCSGSLVATARRRAATAMVDAGLPCTQEDAYQLQIQLQEKFGPRCNVFEEIASEYQLDESFVHKALEAYNSDEVSNIEPFPDVIPTLQELRAKGFKLAIISTGVYRRQEKKIELLGLRPYVDKVEIIDSERGLLKHYCFRQVLNELGVTADQSMTVGDRVHAEIRIGKGFGMTTVQMLHGRFQQLMPEAEEERPDFQIQQISELPAIINLAQRQRVTGKPHILAIGGGTGLPMVLRGLRRYTSNLTAVVTVTDSGRSSGMLRNELGIL